MRPIAVGLCVAVLLLLHVVLAVRLVDTSPGGAEPYWQLAEARGTPGADYTVAYPVMTVEALRIQHAIASDRDQFGSILVVSNMIFDLLIVVLILRNWGAAPAIVYLVGVALLGKLVFDKTDLLATLVTTWAVVSAMRARSRRSAAAVALAGSLKLWPFALAPLLLPLERERMRRYVASLLVTTAIVIVISLVVLGREGSMQSITFGNARGWEIESLPANILRLFTSDSARREAGAWRVGDGSPLVEAVLTIAQVVIVLGAAWFGRRSQRYAAGWIASVTALLMFSTLLSPQFVVWLLPAAALAWASNERILAGSVLMVAALTRLEFGGVLGIGGFGDLIAGHDAAVAQLSARNVALVGTLVLAVHRLLREPARHSSRGVAPAR
ncbi:MAG TPA: glycosyltransferase 87 family protein [Acidimicrobiia bacterium]